MFFISSLLCTSGSHTLPSQHTSTQAERNNIEHTPGNGLFCNELTTAGRSPSHPLQAWTSADIAIRKPPEHQTTRQRRKTSGETSGRPAGSGKEAPLSVFRGGRAGICFGDTGVRSTRFSARKRRLLWQARVVQDARSRVATRPRPLGWRARGAASTAPFTPCQE